MRTNTLLDGDGEPRPVVRRRQDRRSCTPRNAGWVATYRRIDGMTDEEYVLEGRVCFGRAVARDPSLPELPGDGVLRSPAVARHTPWRTAPTFATTSVAAGSSR